MENELRHGAYFPSLWGLASDHAVAAAVTAQLGRYDAAAPVPSNSAGVAKALNELAEALVSTEDDEGEDGGDEGELEDGLVSTDSGSHGELQLLLDVHLISSSSDNSGGEDGDNEDAAEGGDEE